MKALLLLPLLALAGCSIVKELERGNLAVIHHTRAVGIEAQIPNQAGDTILKFRLGWFSDTTTLIPCGTNAIYAAPISDTFKLGNAISFTSNSATIIEDVQTFAPGATPPTPRSQIFAPKSGP